jgi:hypothetical protein
MCRGRGCFCCGCFGGLLSFCGFDVGGLYGWGCGCAIVWVFSGLFCDS